MAEKRKIEADGFFKSASEIERVIGYVFRDKSLLRQAFTRTSYCNEHRLSKTEKYQSNEVLEFFGDGVLSLAIITFLLTDCTERYQGGIKTALNEGDFSRIKSRLSDKKNLSDSIRALGLERYLMLGEGDAKLGVEKEMSVMEDLYESIIGAVYIDSGKSISDVMRVVERTLDLSSYAKSEPPKQSAKNALQEWCQDKKRRLPIPVYKTVRREGPDHKPVYEEGCFIGDRLVATGIGKSEKLADANAAEAALEILMREEKASEEQKRAHTASEKQASPDKQDAPTAKLGKGGAPTTAKSTPAPTAKAKKPDTATVAKSICKPALKAKKPDTPPASAVKPSQVSKPAAATAPKQRIDRSDTKASAKEALSSVAKLRVYAKAQGMLGASFIDVGRGNDGFYSVECRFMNKSATGRARTKDEAKESAARTMLAKLGKR